MRPRTEPMRRARLRPTKRTAKETRRIYGTDDHQKWLRDMPCLGCARIGTDDRPHHLHHVKNGGMGRKANAAFQVPLCHTCHAFLHQHGPKTFQAAYWRMLGGRTLVEWAAHYATTWARQSNPEPLASIVPRVLAELSEGDAE